MEAARHLFAVDSVTGEVLEDGCPECERRKAELADAEMELRTKRAQITRLKNELATAMGVEPEAEQVMEVLEFWRVRCMPNASIVIGSERWKAVRARLRDTDAQTKQPVYDVLRLKAAVVGVMLSDFHKQNRQYLDAASIFGDSRKVDQHIQRAIGFKRRTGTSALGLVDELRSEGLAWLAERCACGHVWLEHLRHGGPTPDGRQPCATCDCPDFDWFEAKVDRWEREHRQCEGERCTNAVRVDSGERLCPRCRRWEDERR